MTREIFDFTKIELPGTSIIMNSNAQIRVGVNVETQVATFGCSHEIATKLIKPVEVDFDKLDEAIIFLEKNRDTPDKEFEFTPWLMGQTVMSMILNIDLSFLGQNLCQRFTFLEWDIFVTWYQALKDG